MTSNFLIYGSYGYTGRLIAEHAVQQGLKPILAGRRENELRVQARSLGLPYRHFSLENTAALTSALEAVDAVLHCAGPFVQTFRRMAEACLANGKHYVDISGELEGFEALHALDARARQAGVMLLPGAGFDVVPSDCLIKYLSDRLPSATHARLYIRSLRGGVSRGTAQSSIENMHRQGRIRRNGKIIPVPPAWQVQEVDFGSGPVRLVSIGWGDVSTVYHSTGIPNVETYMALPRLLISFLYASRIIGPLLYLRPVKQFLKWLVRTLLPPGPSRALNENGFTLMIGEVSNGDRTLRARLRTPEGYRLTALTSVEIMRRILAGARPGFHTPASFFGPDFILQFPGVEREDLHN